MSNNWEDEMDKMLLALKRQARTTLRTIKAGAERDGHPLSPQFKEYFLTASIAQ